jgi:hypothetical protein
MRDDEMDGFSTACTKQTSQRMKAAKTQSMTKARKEEIH